MSPPFVSETLIGPFTQALTLEQLPLMGPLCDQQLTIQKHVGILIKGGLIAEIGPWSDLAPRIDQKAVRPIGALLEEAGFSSSACTVTPGFVDAHTHLCWAGSRARDCADRLSGVSYEEIAARGGGICDTMRHTRNSCEEELFELNQTRLNQHLRRGVTTVEIKSGYGLSISEELKQLNVIRALSTSTPQRIIPTCLAAHVLPPEYKNSSSKDGCRQYLNDVLTHLLPQLRSANLATRVDAFIEPSAFPVEIARPYLIQAKALGFDLAIHADQFSTGGALLASELGARSADHLEASSPSDLAALAQAGVTAVALPGASLGLGIPFTPARTALDLGCSLAIASDWNPGSAPMGHLLLQASVLGAAEKLSAAEVWAGLTTRAAHALNLSQVGALLPGWSADLLVFPTDDYREILYHQGMMSPAAVWARGEQIALH